jgi:uncharacterized protein (TIGR00251 family)
VTGWLRETAAGVSLAVIAAPRASRTEIAGLAEGRLKVRLAAPPVEGEANRELVRYLARALGVPRSAIAVTAGAGGRRKTVAVRGLGAEEARSRLLRQDPPGARGGAGGRLPEDN